MSDRNRPSTNTKQPMKIKTELNGLWGRLTRMLLTDPVSQEDSKVRSKGRDISSSYPEAIPENE